VRDWVYEQCLHRRHYFSKAPQTRHGAGFADLLQQLAVALALSAVPPSLLAPQTTPAAGSQKTIRWWCCPECVKGSMAEQCQHKRRHSSTARLKKNAADVAALTLPLAYVSGLHLDPRSSSLLAF
jgi:hypothetical protein